MGEFSLADPFRTKAFAISYASHAAGSNVAKPDKEKKEKKKKLESRIEKKKKKNFARLNLHRSKTSSRPRLQYKSFHWDFFLSSSSLPSPSLRLFLFLFSPIENENVFLFFFNCGVYGFHTCDINFIECLSNQINNDVSLIDFSLLNKIHS